MNRDWIEEYINLMFGINHTLDTMAKAADIKWEHMPQILYKYRKVSKNTIDALENDYLVSSNVDGFNDNLEVPIVIEDKLNFYNDFFFDEFDVPDIIRPYISGMNNDSFVENSQFADKLESVVNDIVTRTKNMYSLLCFSERSDIQPMWAHYANNNSAVWNDCIG